MAEAELVKKMAEISAFEEVLKARLGHLTERLAALESERLAYMEHLERLENQTLYDHGYTSVDEQYRERWESPTTFVPSSGENVDRQQMKRLYHELARRYHPDLAYNKVDEADRHGRMAALNDAYAAGSLVELLALSDSKSLQAAGLIDDGPAKEQMIQALEIELSRVKRRLVEIETEAKNLHNHPSIQLSLKVKLARLNGRNLLGEMAAGLERQIELRTNECDALQVKIEQAGIAPEKTRPKKHSAPLARRIRERARQARLPQPNPAPPNPGPDPHHLPLGLQLFD